MEKTKYIHYGHKEFDPDKFMEIKNRGCFIKPSGGLWASAVDAPYGWKDWCKDAEYSECDPNNAFEFTLADGSNVLHIRSKEDLESLPHIETDLELNWHALDFEKIKELGVDAIELHINQNLFLDQLMYGWDCDSILVLNKDVIEVVAKT